MEAVPQPFSSFDSLYRFFSDVDEIVFQLSFKIDIQRIACLCREARHLANHLRMHFGARTATDLARIYGVQIGREPFPPAENRVIYLAECALSPPQIHLNLDAINALAVYGDKVAGEAEKFWFSEARILEVVTAHELYHIIHQRSSTQSVELEAHCFARAFTETPFSGLLYNALLRQIPKTL